MLKILMNDMKLQLKMKMEQRHAMLKGEFILKVENKEQMDLWLSEHDWKRKGSATVTVIPRSKVHKEMISKRKSDSTKSGKESMALGIAEICLCYEIC